MGLIATRDPRFFISHATPADAALALDFMRKLGAYQRMENEITATEASISVLLAEKHGEALFAILDGDLVGMLFFSKTCSAFTGRSGLFIDAFVLDDTLRQQGYGSIMMDYLAKLALERGGLMLEWGCLDWNTPAIEFYSKIGAYCIDTMRIYRLSPDNMRIIADRF